MGIKSYIETVTQEEGTASAREIAGQWLFALVGMSDMGAPEERAACGILLEQVRHALEAVEDLEAAETATRFHACAMCEWPTNIPASVEADAPLCASCEDTPEAVCLGLATTPNA